MGFFQGVFGLYGKTRKEEALKLLDRVGLLEKAEEPIKNLSWRTKAKGGNCKSTYAAPGDPAGR